MSRRSYNSAANYKHYNDQEGHINKYIVRHPLTELLESRKWNNIPLPLKEMFYLICDAQVGQDIHTWERKCLTNERITEQQDKSFKLHRRIKKTKKEITIKLREMAEEGRADRIRITQELNMRLDQNIKAVKKESDEMKE